MPSAGTPPESCSVVVIGSGPSGLALATELKRLGVVHIVVLEREKQAGGIPRHCGHYPFGLREYRRLLKGPGYARRNLETAKSLGVEIYTETTVTTLHPGGRISLSSPACVSELTAKRVVLCTGVRESSRSQRFISGDRPSGIVSTGALQSLVYLQAMRPFERPVILGSELVSFSAINTCRHLGIRPVAMVEEQNRIVARRVLQPFLSLRNVPLHVGARNINIVGRKTVETLEFTDRAGNHQAFETDGIIVSGRFRPEAALLYNSHMEIDPGTGGPVIDQYGQCSDPAYYSAGNLLRPAETSGWCWQEGIDTARRIAWDLLAAEQGQSRSVHIRSDDPRIKFTVPQRISVREHPNPMSKMQIGLKEPVKGYLQANSAGRMILRKRIHSRPVRRILLPLKEILNCRSDADIHLTIQD